MPLPPAVPLLRWVGHQRWLPFGLRDRFLRILADPNSLGRAPFTCDFFGLSYRGDLASFIDWMIYFYGAYEGGVLAFLRDCTAWAGPGAVFLDIGANVGQHSLFMARHAAQVHAFEPWPEARGRLEGNLAANDVANVAVHPFGLGDVGGDQLFYAPASANLGTGSFVADVNLNAAMGKLPLLRGDDAMARLGIERVDVVKIDTEGFEVKVLVGLAETLARHRPIVVFELSQATQAELGDTRAGLRRLFGSDWQFLTLGEHPERYRLTEYCGDHDILTVAAVPMEKAASLPQHGDC
jgi:FkbM family methyltransferase